MTTSTEAAVTSPSPLRTHTLWVDGCGGFRLLDGTSWQIGGNAASTDCPIIVQSDWPRSAGTIRWSVGEYWWESPGAEKAWLQDGKLVPVSADSGPTTAKLMFHRPSPLSDSAVLTLASPHRFAGHVDAVLLVREAVLLGATSQCHIKHRNCEQQVVLIRRPTTWQVKWGQQPAVDLKIGQRWACDTVAMTLEQQSS